jgi:hypothetical protein
MIPIYLAQLYPGRAHIAIKILASIVWFISWYWLFIIINLATKEFKQRNTTEGGFSERAYAFFYKLRKNKLFLKGYYLIAAFYHLAPFTFVTLDSKALYISLSRNGTS